MVEPHRGNALAIGHEKGRTLRNADPDIVNVTEVARRYGFTQLGRFAGVYRAVFGESPSTTLKRVPGIRFSSP
jgi:AraC-like DNA-binding protein